MKRHFFGGAALTFLTIALLLSCKGRTEQTHEQSSSEEFIASTEQADGIQRMRPYDYSDTLRVGSHVYSYNIHRESDDALPLVVDDESTRYADNRYQLTIQRDGQSFFERSFSKGSFSSYLSKEFQEKGILDGMMCDRSVAGICFAISVTLPQSDMVEPLLLHIDTSGGISIERDIRSENDFDEL